jgi:hypothetical protein
MDPDIILEDDFTPAKLGVFAFDRSMRTIDADGHLHVETANISKANVCPYYGHEIPNADELGLEPNKVYMLYRDAAELAAAAPTYHNKPLMMTHVAVSADDPQKYYVVGTVSNIRFEHPYLKASLAVWDAKAIEAIDSGAQEQLSCGYRYTADMTPGTSPEGEKYDGVMRGLMCNHVALVETGRAGPDVVVSDELPQDLSTMKISALVKALTPVLATDAKPADVSALIQTVIAADKKAKDAEKDEDKTDMPAKDADKDDKACDADKDEKEAMDADKDDETCDAEMDDMDAEDEEYPKSPEGGAKKPGMDKKGMDAAIKARVQAALAADRALAEARVEVEPLLGKVTFDSAPAVYSAALKKLGVDHAGVHKSALGALYRAHAKAPTAAPAIATDSAGVKSLAEVFPQINRLSR